MRKATKIELTKNSEDKDYEKVSYLKDCFTLRINDEIICNAISEQSSLRLLDSFETWVCTECGFEGCNGAPILMLRKYQGGILFLPEFDCLDSFQEYDRKTSEGERGCPPHEWYVDGVLFVEKDMMPTLLGVCPMLTFDNIPEISKEEMDKMLDWETMVKTKPKGFMADVH